MTTPGRIATRVETDRPVGHLVIDNPARRNALSMSMYRALPDAVDRLVDSDVRVIVIEGAGDEAFCAGSDISEFATHRNADNWRQYAATEHAAHTAVLACPVPTVAAIKGFCRGGGLALAACADLRYAAADATFAVPPGKLGVGYPPDGLEVLAGLVGIAAAKELVLTARVVAADEAQTLGLVHRTVSGSDLPQTVIDTTDQICRLAPLTLRAARAALSLPAHRRSTAAIEDLWAACYQSDDYAEGVRAFTEKRPPVFRGH